MKNLTLKHLRYFEALARHGHFGRAADTCSISQPALSVQIKDLEALLGTALFERGPKGVTLTPFGVESARRARTILQSIEEFGELARAAQQGVLGQLKIGVIPTIAPYLLPNLIGRISQTYPDLDIQIRETVTPRLIEELREGRLDTAIVALPIAEAELTELPLFSEDLALVRPLSDTGQPTPSPESLRHMRLLMLEEGHCFRDQVISFCDLGKGTIREGMDGSSLSTLVQMVGAGIGVTLIPEMAIAVETRAAPVDVTRFAAPAPRRKVGMVWRKTSPLAPQLAQIADLIEAPGATNRARSIETGQGKHARKAP